MPQYVKGKYLKNISQITSLYSVQKLAQSTWLLTSFQKSRNNKFIIFSDSLSMLESLKNSKFDNPLIIKILCKLENLSNDNDVQICWVPSNTGISGNDQADKAARSTLNITTEKKFKIPYKDFKFKDKWINTTTKTTTLDSNKHNELLEIKATLGEWKQGYRKKRKEEVILSRLRIGHTRTTHSYLLETKQQPMCHACQTKYTVKHILIECTNLAHIRETFYSANDKKELFQNIEIKNVISFLKAINIYKKI